MATKAQLEKYLQNPRVRKFLDLIAHTEGTEGNGYRTAFGGGRLGSLSDHPRYMKSFKQQNGKTNKTSAAGRYQFLSSTWDGVAKKYGLNDFSPRNQDLGAVALLAQNGALGSILKGDMTTAVRKSGSTWASLPTAPASYSQPTKSWQTVNRFLGGDYQPSQQQPQADPRLSMSAPDLLATLRKGKGKRNDNEIFMELANNNGLAGRELNHLLSQGANPQDIARDLGLNVSVVQQQPAYEVPDIGGSYDEFMANISTQNEPDSQLPDIGDGYEDFMSKIQVDEPQQQASQMPDIGDNYDDFISKLQIDEPPQEQAQQLPELGENYDDFMSKLNIGSPEPTQAGDTWQTQSSELETTWQPKKEKEPPTAKSLWESPS